jgi:hypothetical protein
MLQTFTSRIKTIQIKACLILLYLTCLLLDVQAQPFEWVQKIATSINSVYPLICTDRFENSLLQGKSDDFIRMGNKVNKAVENTIGKYVTEANTSKQRTKAKFIKL